MPEREPGFTPEEKSTPLTDFTLEEPNEGKLLAQKLINEINALQAGRKLETLTLDELKKIRDKYVEIKKALGIGGEAATESMIIQAKNEKGEPIEFNLEKIKSHWVNFYKENNLPELAKTVEEMEIRLTEEQQDRIKELAEKEGFDKIILFAGNKTMKNNSLKIKQETEKEMEGLPEKQQYSEKDKDGKPIGTYLSDTVKPEFPSNIQNNNRPDKPYIFFCKDADEVDELTRKPIPGGGSEETLANSAKNLRKHFKDKGLTGYTLEEYLIFQREHTENNKELKNPHPDTSYITLLLDSELSPDSKNPGQVLRAYWGPVSQQVRVNSKAPDCSYVDVGARSSAIFEIL